MSPSNMIWRASYAAEEYRQQSVERGQPIRAAVAIISLVLLRLVWRALP